MGSGTRYGGIGRSIRAGLLLAAVMAALAPAAPWAGQPGAPVALPAWPVPQGAERPPRLAPAPIDDEGGAASPYWVGATMLGAGALAMFADGSIQEFYQDKLRGGATDDGSSMFRVFGDGLVLTSMMGAGYLGGLALDDERASRASMSAFQSFVIAGALTEGVKRLARRDRPNQSDDPYAFNGPNAEESGKSFISGHATHAFAAATAVALEYSDDPIVPVAAYGLATLAALSRVNDDRHWASDVILGSAMGYLVGNLVHEFSLFGRREEEPDMLVSPLVRDGFAGLMITIKF